MSIASRSPHVFLNNWLGCCSILSMLGFQAAERKDKVRISSALGAICTNVQFSVIALVGLVMASATVLAIDSGEQTSKLKSGK